MVWPMDQYYLDTLTAYGEDSYKTFHNKLAGEMKAWYKLFPPVPPEHEGMPLGHVLSGDPAARAAGGSQVRQAEMCFNTEEDDNNLTHSEQPAQQSTDSRSGVTSSKPTASELAVTPPTPTGTKNA